MIAYKRCWVKCFIVSIERYAYFIDKIGLRSHLQIELNSNEIMLFTCIYQPNYHSLFMVSCSRTDKIKKSVEIRPFQCAQATRIIEQQQIITKHNEIIYYKRISCKRSIIYFLVEREKEKPRQNDLLIAAVKMRRKSANEKGPTRHQRRIALSRFLKCEYFP